MLVSERGERERERERKGRERVAQFSLFSLFFLLLFTAERMAENDPENEGAHMHERGVIVNTASIAAFEGQIGQAAYASSKGAVVGMGISLARDLSSVGIRVNTVAPGMSFSSLFFFFFFFFFFSLDVIIDKTTLFLVLRYQISPMLTFSLRNLLDPHG